MRFRVIIAPQLFIASFLLDMADEVLLKISGDPLKAREHYHR